MYDRRVSGILLHPTSLPGPGGIGDLGDAAFRFVDWLADAKQRRWQLMPLGPTGYGDSPYAGLSALAGNPLLDLAGAPGPRRPPREGRRGGRRRPAGGPCRLRRRQRPEARPAASRV